MLSLLVTAAAGLVLLHSRGDRLLGVRSGSMEPAFRAGDALVVAPVKPADLKPGDIIAYQSPANPRVTISHRLLAIDRPHGQLITAGDALAAADPAFDQRLLAGKAVALLPGFGYVVDGLRHPLGLALFIWLPALCLIINEIRHLKASFAKRYYRLNVRL
jgi:signal peptidase I